MKHCCEDFAREAGELQAPVGGGLYPPSMRPSAQFEWTGEAWAINGCCGGGCYVVDKMTFCPFCGARLAHHSSANDR